MARYLFFGLLMAASQSLVSALVPGRFPKPNLSPRAGPCSGNTATTRSTWCDYDINTDWYNVVPETGVTREYWLEITDEATASPDGIERYVQLINGSLPGPTIFADWGDTVKVHVTNSLTQSINGTSFHFHGMRQLNTVQNDGVVSITQCPTIPGNSMTYTFRATQYGSSWYHSHYTLQAWAGVFGGIIINGPASANYDVDLGNLFLNDWSHATPDALFHEAESSGPPTLENALINGTNTYNNSGTVTGSRFTQKFESGTSYRLRLVNAAIDTHFVFSIDNHTMTVIAGDLVPIQPYTTNTISIGMGQRYDVIVTADQSSVASNFWMRAAPQSSCSDIEDPSNILGIVYYGDSASEPSTTGYDVIDSCDDEAASNLVPVVVKNVDSPTWTDLEVASVSPNANNVFRWYLNSTTMEVDWSNPTLNQIYDGTTTYADSNAVVELSEADKWAYVIIQTSLTIPHPLHLHGFDFHILSQGTGDYNASSTTLSLSNPMRRDTAMLPASGHIVLAFETDNPGSWLMHCHIGWHTVEGFAMQFIVRKDEILSNNLIDYDTLNNTCTAWKDHVTANSIELNDSGL